jgi:hypothetical protein
MVDLPFELCRFVEVLPIICLLFAHPLALFLLGFFANAARELDSVTSLRL